MNKNKPVLILLLSFFLFMTFFLEKAYARPINKGETTVVEGNTNPEIITPSEPVVEENDNSGEPVENTENGEDEKDKEKNGQTTYTQKEGTEKNPYKRYVKLSSSIGSGKISDAVKSAVKKTDDNGELKYYWKKPADSFISTSGSTWIPEYIENPSIPFHMTTYYSSIWIQTKSVIEKETSVKDDHYQWTVSGPESYIKNSKSHTFEIKFNKTGLYKLVFIPYEERTETRKGTKSGFAYDVWPSGSGKDSVYIDSYSENIAPTTTKAVVANNSRRMEWEFYVTASDMGKTEIIPVPPTPPPGVTPVPGVNIDDEDADVAIID